jgi:kinesin family protein 5
LAARRAALEALQGEGGWFATDWKKAPPPPPTPGQAAEDDASSPLSSSSASGAAFVAHIQHVDPMASKVVAVAPGVGLREFSYDHVLSGSASQGSVYEAAARGLLTDFLNGTSATIVVYGQTGSGKTYTMFGPQHEAPVDEAPTARRSPSSSSSPSSPPAPPAPLPSLSPSSLSEPSLAAAEATAALPAPPASEPAAIPQPAVVPKGLRGIVPRAAAEVLAACDVKRAQGLACSLTVSYVEVFGDDVFDLLRGGAPCGHSKVASQRFVLSGATGVAVGSSDDGDGGVAAVERLLAAGDAVKRRAATAMNDRSSRAHALFIMTLEQRDVRGTACGGSSGSSASSASSASTASTASTASDGGASLGGGTVVTSQLFLADLGGSEQVKRSLVHPGELSAHHGHVLGARMREAVYINLGLLALKKCVAALNRGDAYVPYQDAKLTMLLSPALGGSKSKASVVVCGSLEQDDAPETVQALRFGEACATVEASGSLGVNGAAAILASLDAQVEALEKAIAQKERWETSRVVRVDATAEEGTFEAAAALRVGGEVVTTGRIVGAEGERALLEGLVIRRAAMLGEDVDESLAEAGFGGQYGGAASSAGGHATLRFADQSQGLKMKGKVVAEWAA